MRSIKNKLGIELPSHIDGYGDVKPYEGPWATEPTGQKFAPNKTSSKPGQS